uniref:Uncharacterized protein n=1 Tax=Anguilla anguilla TaxID=7936 RepID=A0A0E9RAY2_ANGAN
MSLCPKNYGAHCIYRRILRLQYFWESFTASTYKAERLSTYKNQIKIYFLKSNV